MMQGRARIFSIAAIATLALSLATSTVTLGSGETAPRSLPLTADHCVRCDGCQGQAKHFAEIHPEGERDGEQHPTECIAPSNCNGEHPTTCGEPVPDLPALLEESRLAAVGNSPASFRALQAEYPIRVTYNANRGAVQVMGCDGASVIANLPVSDESSWPTELDS